MELEYQILFALGLDLLFGDPRWFPHPVRLMGGLAVRLEPLFRAFFPAALGGIVTVAAVLLATGGGVIVLLWASHAIHPGLGTAISVFLLYTTLAARDLATHAQRVRKALNAHDIPAARHEVSMIVGRDTETLDEQEIARAAVESVAENMVDGITAPLFFAMLGGPLGAMLYKAVNTLDSTFGYKNEQYEKFGRAAARLDDLANFIPARLTAFFIPLAALLLGLDYKNSWRILRRDRLRHASPNSGHPEAAMAGALGIQLGGANSYFGRMLEKPVIGDPLKPVTATHIDQALRLVWATLLIFLLFALTAVSTVPS